MKLEALIFDVDGTLVDTEELHRQSYNQTFVDFGINWDWNAATYTELLSVSGGQARIAHYIDLVDMMPDEKTRLRRIIPAIHKEKTRLYGELAANKNVALRPGIARLIDEAHTAGIRVGLVASSASENVETLVSSALGNKLRKAVGAIVCGDMVKRKKPAPDIYELMLTMLHVPAQATVAFEDSLNGLTAAKSVGLFTVVTPSRWTMTHAFQGADVVLSSLGDPDQPVDAADRAKIGAPCLELAALQKLRSEKGPALKLRQAGS